MDVLKLQSKTKQPLNHDYRLRIYRHCIISFFLSFAFSLCLSFSRFFSISMCSVYITFSSCFHYERLCILIEAMATVFSFDSTFIISLECCCSWVYYGFSAHTLQTTISTTHWRQRRWWRWRRQRRYSVSVVIFFFFSLCSQFLFPSLSLPFIFPFSHGSIARFNPIVLRYTCGICSVVYIVCLFALKSNLTETCRCMTNACQPCLIKLNACT